jgi:DNA-binding MurR/RpiR family transcriptional regulator
MIDFEAAKSVIENSKINTKDKDSLNDFLDEQQHFLTRIEEMILNERFNDAVEAIRGNGGGSATRRAKS